MEETRTEEKTKITVTNHEVIWMAVGSIGTALLSLIFGSGMEKAKRKVAYDKGYADGKCDGVSQVLNNAKNTTP